MFTAKLTEFFWLPGDTIKAIKMKNFTNNISNKEIYPIFKNFIMPGEFIYVQNVVKIVVVSTIASKIMNHKYNTLNIYTNYIDK